MNLEQKVVELIGQFQSLAAPGLDLAIRIVRVEAISDLVFGAIGALVTVLTIRIAKGRYRSHMAEHQGDDLIDVPHIVLPAALIIIFAAAYAGHGLLNVWNWVALFDPELALAHKLITKVAG